MINDNRRVSTPATSGRLGAWAYFCLPILHQKRLPADTFLKFVLKQHEGDWNRFLSKAFPFDEVQKRLNKKPNFSFK